MRIPIRLQLGGLLLISSLIGLAVISVAVWITVREFVLDIRATRLSLVASLKAAQLASNLDLMQTSAGFITTRVLLQRALQDYNDNGSIDPSFWDASSADMQAAIGGQTSLGQQLLIQSRIYPRDASGPTGSAALLNTTADVALGQLPLPSGVTLGDDSSIYGFPPELYPNLTYSTESVDGRAVYRARYQDKLLYQNSTLLLGPWLINDTYSLVSLTMPVVNNTSYADVLGFLTVVMDGRLISQVLDSDTGLGNSGATLLVGPSGRSNVFAPDLSVDDDRSRSEIEVRYVLPLNHTLEERHPDHVRGTANAPFNAADFPAVYNALAAHNDAERMGSNLRAKNEDGNKVSVGFASPATDIVEWTILVEMSRNEVWQPINTLRNVILACLFGTAGFMIIIAWPLAHFASLPILRLREATQRSVEPSDPRSSLESLGIASRDGAEEQDAERAESVMARKEGFRRPVTRWRRNRIATAEAKREERNRRAFRIPGKVKERKFWIKDELSDLTETFNEMSDELMMQYSRLEERVQQRTAELELSKQAAEAANESKTLFIANISHELKTPLNGILGMCAVCMQEDDPLRLKRSLGIIYKSGDLLLNLLTDLLTFSKNQVGQQLSLDEKEFRLRDVSSQTLAIFDKQAKDGKIELRVEFEEGEALGHDGASPEQQSNYGPPSTGRMRDMILWGDIHRILQVVINLVSNSLKFTPAGGSVVLTIRCLPEMPELGSRKGSTNSRQSRRVSSRHRASDVSSAKYDTANAINVKGKPFASTYVSERAASPPPGRYVWFEFEVADTGPGIPESIQDKIFEPFVQGDLGLSKKYGGTGLGLSICSQLAGLMRGSISVRSTVGLGSTFTMKLPLRHLQSRADSSASSALNRSEGDSSRFSLDGDERASSMHVHGPVEYNADTASLSDDVKPLPKVAVDSASTKSNPRLVGLSQPFFATDQPLESPGSQPAAMERLAAQANRGSKIRVLGECHSICCPRSHIANYDCSC